MRRRGILVIALALEVALCSGLSALAAMPLPAAGQKLLAIARNPAVAALAYPNLKPPLYWPDGAAGANREWERGWSHWYVDEQERGAQLLVHGVLGRDPASILDGDKMIEWALARQGLDGGFPGSSDRYYSTCRFVTAVSQAGLMLEASKQGAAHGTLLVRYRAAMSRALGWLLEPARMAKQVVLMRPFGDRKFAQAAAIHMGSLFTEEPNLEPQATRLIHEAIASEDSAGEILEGGAYDSAYQALALEDAELVAFTSPPSAPYRASLLRVIDRGLQWEAGRVTPDGRVLTDGNTRTAGQEKNHMEQARQVSYRAVALSFLYGALLTSAHRRQEIARRVAEHVPG